MFQVRVNGLRFHGFHGVLSQEKAEGNEFTATILANVDGSADQTDQLKDTVDYSALSNLLTDVSDAYKFDTVERLAGAFAEAALARFPIIQELNLTIDKLSPPRMPNVESCGVKLTVSRNSGWPTVVDSR